MKNINSITSYNHFTPRPKGKEWREISESERKREMYIRTRSAALVIILTLSLLITIYLLATSTFTETWFDRMGERHVHQVTTAVFIPFPAVFGGGGLIAAALTGVFYDAEKPRIELKNLVEKEALAGKLATSTLSELYHSEIRTHSFAPAVNAGILTKKLARKLRALLDDKEVHAYVNGKPLAKSSIQRIEKSWKRLHNTMRKRIIAETA